MLRCTVNSYNHDNLMWTRTSKSLSFLGEGYSAGKKTRRARWKEKCSSEQQKELSSTISLPDNKESVCLAASAVRNGIVGIEYALPAPNGIVEIASAVFGPKAIESLVRSLKKLIRREGKQGLCASWPGESHLSSRIHECDWKPSLC